MRKHLGPCLAAVSIAAISLNLAAAEPAGPWTAARANAWYEQQPWLVGCNFSPSTAINQLEMWQADTFDPATIDRELGWAQELGFTSIRVFLHHLPWEADAKGFLARIERFLEIAEKRRIGVMFVLLDACWDPFPKSGRQRDPKPHVHNSGWVQCPGREVIEKPARHDELRPFVTGIIRHFRNDKRVHVWDLFNEPDNTNRSSYGAQEPANKGELALALIRKTFAWAREAEPSQPLTAGVWIGNWGDPAKLSAIEQFMLGNSDVISFHNYAEAPELEKCITHLRRYGRPILCTEYMARPNGSRFDPHLGLMKAHKVAAYNWGFVDGKTQTIYPWDSWKQTYTAPPPVWFHDIFRKDGTPFDAAEVRYIRSVTGKAAAKSAPAQ